MIIPNNNNSKDESRSYNSKQQADLHFSKGYKYQELKDYQRALNEYELGIKNFPDSSYNCKFNKGVILFKLGLV